MKDAVSRLVPSRDNLFCSASSNCLAKPVSDSPAVSRGSSFNMLSTSSSSLTWYLVIDSVDLLGSLSDPGPGDLPRFSSFRGDLPCIDSSSVVIKEVAAVEFDLYEKRFVLSVSVVLMV